MDKLVERESAPRNPLVAAPALAVQFFLIPLAVVAVTAAVYLGFRAMLVDSRSAHDYLAEIQNGGTDRRWPAAYELSRLMDRVRTGERRRPADPALPGARNRAARSSVAAERGRRAQPIARRVASGRDRELDGASDGMVRQ